MCFIKWNDLFFLKSRGRLKQSAATSFRIISGGLELVI